MCRVAKRMAAVQRCSCVFAGLVLLLAGATSASYLGKRIGPLSQLEHGVSGEVYAVDSRTLHIKGFSYDGQAPDAFFFAGTSGRPSNNGIIIPDENGSTKPLKAYNGKDVTLTLPEGITLKEIKWISVWCKAYSIDFGNLLIPGNLQYPRPQKIDAFPNLSHEVLSDRIVVVDAQTFLIPNFSYDGLAPGGYNRPSSSVRKSNRNSRYREDSDERRSSPSSRYDDVSSESVFNGATQYRPPNSFGQSSYRQASSSTRQLSSSSRSSHSSNDQSFNYNRGSSSNFSNNRQQNSAKNSRSNQNSAPQRNNNSYNNNNGGASALALKHFGR